MFDIPWVICALLFYLFTRTVTNGAAWESFINRFYDHRPDFPKWLLIMLPEIDEDKIYHKKDF